MFTKHITDKGLVFRVYKEFSKLSKMNNPILKNQYKTGKFIVGK